MTEPCHVVGLDTEGDSNAIGNGFDARQMDYLTGLADGVLISRKHVMQTSVLNGLSVDQRAQLCMMFEYLLECLNTRRVRHLEPAIISALVG